MSPPEWQRQRFAAWLHEWRLAEELRGAEPPTGDVAASQADGWGAMVEDPGRDPVAAGQIRLVVPLGEITTQRPVHLAILREEPDGDYRVAPFGRFSEPATPGELATGRDTPCLRVLCLWNARCLSSEQLRRSWLVDDMSGPEHKTFLKALRTVAGSGALPSELAADGGPAVSHPDDPRHGYLDGESLAMDSVVAELRDTAGGRSTVYPTRDEHDLPMAAEPGEDYDAPEARERPEAPESDPDRPDPAH